MAIDIAFCTTLEDVAAGLVPIRHYFGAGPPNAEDIERFRHFLAPDRMIAARDGTEVVGGAGSFPFELTVPGGTVRAAGVSVVGVLPTHRRRGVLRGMMRAQLDDAHARGEPVAYLWASEDTIYGRFGYGMASVTASVEIPRSAATFARPFEPQATVRLLDEAAALEQLPKVYDLVRVATPGMVARGPDWWKHRRMADTEMARQGRGMLNRAVLSIDGAPRGYALYRAQRIFEAGGMHGVLHVIEAMGADAAATREIWSFLFGVDWMAKLRAEILPVDHPLLHLTARPREMNMRIHDGVWVRMLDIPAALAARTRGAGEVVLEVDDAFCPWNAGRYRVDGGGAARTTAAADLTLDVTALGSVYLGGFSFRQLAEAGRVEEQRAGALARADAVLPTGRAPWCPEIF